ncbi:MAG: RnfABCDGE type electron transport complex subunit B [Desulfobacterales bacterium]|nr:RnfABCDGE type electron transport complex subunit B [Desulfobacterales bacterium]
MGESILPALIMLGGIGITVGIVLAAASKIFYVYVDPKILAIEDVLPGANCGGCGLPGCSANAEAIVAGRAGANSCVAAGSDVAEAIAGIMGLSIEAKEPDIARPGCYYGVAKADQKYHYDGLNDCRAVAMLGGGMKICSIGCLGLGTCAQACPFSAIVMGPEGLPVVDEIKCTGCGTCERVCPKAIINLSSVTRRILREYTTDDCTTPCQRACPAGIDIREYMRRAANGDYQGSVQVIKERNPFPTVIGRICPRPCEDECRRKYAEESVAINFIKRYVADYEMQSGTRIQPYKAPDTGRRIAVVGGGVEGLSAAFFAARLGHAPVVYEAADRLGGLLRSAISRYRLSHEVLDWDIEGILEMGVEARLNQALGSDFTIADLLGEDYETVFLASGGWDSRLARNEADAVNEFIPGTYLLIDFIRAGRNDDDRIQVGRNVVIISGDNLAAEAAEIAARKGAATITVLLREDLENARLDQGAVERLEKVSAKVVYGAGISRLAGKGNTLETVSYTDLQTGAQTEIPAESLVLAAGRYPELIFSRVRTAAAEGEIQPSVAEAIGWAAVQPYKQPEFVSEVGLFAKGDVITDFSGAIKAIAGGRRAAASMHQLMYDIPIDVPLKAVTSDCVIQNVDAVEEVRIESRRIMPMAAPRELDQTGQLELGFDEDAARKEASRCLQCGLICYEHTLAAGAADIDASKRIA